MPTRLIVWNRGEIAVRACLAAKRLGMTAILFVTPDDAESPAVRYADELHVFASSDAAETFLSLGAVGAAIASTRADWVYPGYGFLSETEELCRAVTESGAGFVGPGPHALRAMADKGLARELSRAAGVADLDVPLVRAISQATAGDARVTAPPASAFPLLLKAAKGGGGRGNALVATPADFDATLDRLRARARALFHDDAVIAERFLTTARHIELQIFGIRGYGVRALGTRDCSVQRAYQKVIEEGPAPVAARAAVDAVTPGLLRALEAISYHGAGTVEFLWDTREERLYFIEVNPRIQVEHTVTELLTGEDLVEWQLREAVGIAREDLFARAIAGRGHAMQLRVYAEDPHAAFAPDAGTPMLLEFPPMPFCRFDLAVRAGARISPRFDPLLAKVIVSGATREETVERASACLRLTAAHGVRTNLELLAAVLRDPAFRADAHDVGWLETTLLPTLVPAAPPSGLVASALDALFGEPARSGERSTQQIEEGLTWKQAHRS